MGWSCCEGRSSTRTDRRTFLRGTMWALGTALMGPGVQPSQRWRLLLEAPPWEDWFEHVAQKTHHERRSWFALLGANRRVFLLHGVCFAFGLTVALPSVQKPTSWDLNGWGVLMSMLSGTRTVL